MTIVATLCYLIKDGKILLIKKKHGFGVGKWNGPGGKVNNGEGIADAAVRETEEETGLKPKNISKIGEIDFYYEDGSEDWNAHIFVADDCSGTMRESDEAEPKWFPVTKIPYADMWPDDAHWMPLMLDGKRFSGKFYFDFAKNIVRHEIKVI